MLAIRVIAWGTERCTPSLLVAITSAGGSIFNTVVMDACVAVVDVVGQV